MVAPGWKERRPSSVATPIDWCLAGSGSWSIPIDLAWMPTSSDCDPSAGGSSCSTKGVSSSPVPRCPIRSEIGQWIRNRPTLPSVQRQDSMAHCLMSSASPSPNSHSLTSLRPSCSWNNCIEHTRSWTGPHIIAHEQRVKMHGRSICPWPRSGSSSLRVSWRSPCSP